MEGLAPRRASQRYGHQHPRRPIVTKIQPTRFSDDLETLFDGGVHG
jgi:hypothetical protein